MKRTSIARLTVILILVIALLSSFSATVFAASYPYSASKNFVEGARTYNAYMSKTDNSEYVTPITDTQIYHTRGIESYVAITKTYETSWTGTGQIKTGYSGIFIDLSSTIGVTKTTTHATDVTVAFTIPASMASGYYRIEQRCPNYRVREVLSDMTNYGILKIFDEVLQCMPGLNEGYHMINQYQPG